MFKLEIAFQTDVGKKRSTNQDSVGVFENKKKIKIGIVADGMGGHQAGDVASRLTVMDLGTIWENSELSDETEIKEWLVENIQRLNQEIFEEGQTNPDKLGMGTTIVAVAIIEDKVILANVGDSRSYLVRNHQITQLTEDHSLVNELLKNGEITKEEALRHPRKNVLLRSLGIPGQVDVDIISLMIEEKDKILLCSDGLSNMISDETILEILDNELTIKEMLETLINEANAAGGRDNITVLITLIEKEVGEE